ncbi:hypothetical protein DFP72DRAFT_1169508 [Ephemerocybe angulata]|uniref:BTB domain-containing protein n=1 Tax=Ephemerocybe angulata TaxID=980116 RepID=A0A8H6HYQ4_9AGAR|nr:hypothetical protein DFP72DRAFT_1169508 [Tulosesus angulatus]
MSTRSADFYWETIVFKVEDTLFRVPRHGLESASDVFADMSRLPTGVGGQTVVEGQSDDNSIVLEGYTGSEFRSLLKILYPSATKVDSVWGDPSLSTTITLCKVEWIDVLKLSTAGEMDAVRATAIAELLGENMLTPVEMVVLAREYRVLKFLEEGLCSLVTQQPGYRTPLETLGANLGWESAARVVWIQQQLELADQIASGEAIEFTPSSIQCMSCSNNVMQLDRDDDDDDNNNHNVCMNCPETLQKDERLYAVGLPFRGSTDGEEFIVPLSGILCSYRGVGPSCPSTEIENAESKTCVSCKAIILRSDQVLITEIIGRVSRVPESQEPEPVDAWGYISRFFKEEVDSLRPIPRTP